MNPLIPAFVALALFGSKRKRKPKEGGAEAKDLGTEKKASGKGVAGKRTSRRARLRNRIAKADPNARVVVRNPHAMFVGGQTDSARPPKRQNGKKRGKWTPFPWIPERVTEVAQELILKGEIDPDKLTLAVAKTIYPVHPHTGQTFPWRKPGEGPEEERDIGADMIWNRIRLRVNTLVAVDEERAADDATVHMEAEKQRLEAQQASVVLQTPTQLEAEEEVEEAEDGEEEGVEEGVEDEEEGEEDDGDEDPDDDPEPTSPRIGRASPNQKPEAPAPSGKRGMTLKGRRSSQSLFDPYALHPPDEQLRDGVFHTVAPAETIHQIAHGALSGSGVAPNPTAEMVARYVALIVSSPYNPDLQMQWDDEFDLPGAPPFPWGMGRPVIWLPKVNDGQLREGIVTTLGVVWADGASGLTPPPGMRGRDA